MPGTFTFKPIEANLTHNTDILGQMNPLCSFVVGHEKHNSQPCYKGGKHPYWNDTVTVHTDTEPQVKLQLLDKAMLFHDDVIGSCMINLKDIEAQKQSRSWYPLTFKDEPAGEILVETTYEPDKGSNLDENLMGSKQGELLGSWKGSYQSDDMKSKPQWEESKDTEMKNQQEGMNKQSMEEDLGYDKTKTRRLKSVEEGTKYEEVYDKHLETAGFAYESMRRKKAGLPPPKEVVIEQPETMEGLGKRTVSGSLEYKKEKNEESSNIERKGEEKTKWDV